MAALSEMDSEAGETVNTALSSKPCFFDLGLRIVVTTCVCISLVRVAMLPAR